MNMLTTISAGFAWGGFLSLLHFGGLWLSLSLMPRMPRPRLWFFGGLLGRYAVTLGGVWLALRQGTAGSHGGLRRILRHAHDPGAAALQHGEMTWTSPLIPLSAPDGVSRS